MTYKLSFLSIQLSRFLSGGVDYHPIWCNSKPVFMMVPILLVFGTLILSSVSIIVFFLIFPLFIPSHPLMTQYWMPYILMIIVVAPILAIFAHYLYLIILRVFTLTFRKSISDQEFLKSLWVDASTSNFVLVVRQAIGECYQVESSKIHAYDNARTLSLLGVYLHPNRIELIERVTRLVGDDNIKYLYAIESIKEYDTFSDVRDLILKVTDYLDSVD